jgi:hypothetical protein
VSQSKSVAEWMAERGITLRELIDASKLEDRIAEAIAMGRYTPSPKQRECVAAVLGISAELIRWDHRASVEHLYGHGPQFGRSP